MSSPRLLSTLAILGLVSTGLPAWAADPTPAQATDLQEQIRGWLASLVNPAIDVGKQPVQVTVNGDHFDVTIPAPALASDSGIVAPGQKIMVAAKPLDGGRYSLDHLVLPNPLKLTVPAGFVPPEAPVPPGSPPGTVPPPPAIKAGDSMEISAQTIDFHGLLDPSFATTSSFDTTYTGFHIVGPNSNSTTASVVSHSTWQPTGDGLLTILADGNSTNAVAQIKTKDGHTVNYSIGASRSTAHVNGVSPSSMATLIRSISALVPTLAGTKDSLDPQQRVLARAAVTAFFDIYGSVETNQSLSNIKFEADGHSGTIAKAGIVLKTGLDDGKIQLINELSISGIDSPEVPPGVFRDYLPRSFSIKPRVSGIPKEDLMKLAMKAIDSSSADMADLQEQAVALLGAGPLEVALDDLSLDLGKASLVGNGTLDIASPTDITGEAEITIDGLDAMIKTANTTPQLKQAAPVLIFLKGIGKTDGTKTVWNIKYEDSKVTVNDTDLSDLMPSK